MKWMTFISLCTFFLIKSTINAMEKQSDNTIVFQPKKLLELCIKQYYANHNSKKDKKLYDSPMKVRKINTLHKKIPLSWYPTIGYHVLQCEKIPERDKIAIITFLRDYPEKIPKESKKILNYFVRYLNTKLIYHSSLLAMAVLPKYDLFFFQFLLEQGEVPTSHCVWQLIGNEKCLFQVQENNTTKLKCLLRFNPPLIPKPCNAFVLSSGLTPPEYTRAMLTCWCDEEWTKGYKQKEFKNFKSIIHEPISRERVEEYRNFYTKAVELFTEHEKKLATTSLKSQPH